MLRISKSKYVMFCQCEKMLYLDKYYKDEKKVSKETEYIFKMGNEVGDLAMRLFGEYTEVTSFNENNELDLLKMCEKTNECINNKVAHICEASFMFEGLYCAVDILSLNEDGYDIYEVKSSTKVKDVHLLDISYQKYVLEHCGVKIKNCYLVTINSKYERIGELDINQLFTITNVDNLIQKHYLNVHDNLVRAEMILEDDKILAKPISNQCLYPYECMYKAYCFKDIIVPSIFNLYQLENKGKLYTNGIISYEDVFRSKISLSKVQKVQIVTELNHQEEYLESVNLKAFFNQVNYPLTFLSIGAVNPAIPPFDHTKPYLTLPFMYDALIFDSKDKRCLEKQFISKDESDPRLKLALNIIEALKEVQTIIVYDKEDIYALKSLFYQFKDLRIDFANIISRVVSLSDIFLQGFYYHKSLLDDFSFKRVVQVLLNEEIDDSIVYNDYLPSIKDHNDAQIETIQNQNQNRNSKLVKLFFQLREKTYQE